MLADAIYIGGGLLTLLAFIVLVLLIIRLWPR